MKIYICGEIGAEQNKTSKKNNKNVNVDSANCITGLSAREKTRDWTAFV